MLIIILVLAALLRGIGLTQVPPSLNWDEVSHAYNAYSLYKTGKDQWGQVLPIVNFRAFGDYPTTLNLYMTVPFIAFGGVNDTVVRLPHVLAGVLTVLALFLAVYSWFGSRRVGLWVAFIASVSPWLVWSSRQILQSNWVVLIASLGLAYYGRKKTTKALWIWGLGLFAYHNVRIFLPLLLIVIMFINKTIRTPLVILAISILVLFFPGSRARNEWIGIINPGSISAIESNRNRSQLPNAMSRLIYNRPVYFISTFLKNYMDYLDPRYLFINGGTQYQFSIPNWGLMPWLVLPFFYWGITKITRGQIFLVVWLLLAIVPAAITIDRFAVIRSTLMIPAVLLIAGLGLSKLQNIKFKFLLIASMLIYISFYIKDMTIDYPKKYSQSWQYGYKEVVQIIKENYTKYDNIVVSKRYGEPHEYLLWYWPWNPSDYHPDWDFHTNWYWVNQFDKIKFVNDWEMKSYAFNPKTLIIASPENIPIGNEIKTINFLDGKPAFIIKEL